MFVYWHRLCLINLVQKYFREKKMGENAVQNALEGWKRLY
jgi:hypothetical protein